MDDTRRQRILELRAAGWSYARIGAEYGVSRQRVWTILNEPRARREVRALAQKHEIAPPAPKSRRGWLSAFDGSAALD